VITGSWERYELRYELRCGSGISLGLANIEKFSFALSTGACSSHAQAFSHENIGFRYGQRMSVLENNHVTALLQPSNIDRDSVTHGPPEGSDLHPLPAGIEALSAPPEFLLPIYTASPGAALSELGPAMHEVLQQTLPQSGEPPSEWTAFPRMDPRPNVRSH
jgi:hypothetical protein